MENRFNVITVGIDDECRVIAWMIRALAWRSIILATGGHYGPMEAIDSLPIFGLKGEVHTTRQNPPCRLAIFAGDEQFVSPEVVLAFASHGDIQGAEDSSIETFACGEILHNELHVVEQAAAVQFHVVLQLRVRCASLGV